MTREDLQPRYDMQTYLEKLREKMNVAGHDAMCVQMSSSTWELFQVEAARQQVVFPELDPERQAPRTLHGVPVVIVEDTPRGIVHTVFKRSDHDAT